MADTFDIVVNGEKKGSVIDGNSSITIETDDECEALLSLILKDASLSTKERHLFESCSKINAADIGQDVEFGPAELLELSMIAMAHPSLADEIMAISHYLVENISFEGDMPPDLFAKMAEAHTALSEIFSDALEKKDEDDSDSDSDSDISDSE